MFETEIQAAMHSDINVSGLYCIKSETETTIVKVCLSSTKHTAKFEKNVGILIDVHVLNKFIRGHGVSRDR